MVHSSGGVKMAVMARFLSAAKDSLTNKDGVDEHKIVSQYVLNELAEADEANLLDEEDMHVFGLKPMTDPLYLVRCNACKKPIKASQYAAHAELCRSLLSKEEFLLERDGDVGQKKPPRTERKRSKAAINQASLVGTQEQYGTVDPFSVAASRCPPMGQNALTSTLAVDGKDGSRCSTLSRANGNCLTSANTTVSAAAIVPLSKRPKLLAADMLHSDGMVAAQPASNVFSDVTTTSNAVAPLATKMYYSQRNNRLRAALCYMYHEGSTRHWSDGASPRALEEKFMTWDTISPRIAPKEVLPKQAEQLNGQILPSLQNPIQTIAQNSGVCLNQMVGCQPMNNPSPPKQFTGNDVLASQTPAVDVMTNKFGSKPYSFAPNSGATLTPTQQPGGSVPVV